MVIDKNLLCGDYNSYQKTDAIFTNHEYLINLNTSCLDNVSSINKNYWEKGQKINTEKDYQFLQ